MKKKVIFLFLCIGLVVAVGCGKKVASNLDSEKETIEKNQVEMIQEDDTEILSEEEAPEILGEEAAKIISEDIGITIEENVDVIEEDPAETPKEDLQIIYGESKIFSQEDLDTAIDEVLQEFATWDGCKFDHIKYVSDDNSNPKNLKWMNELGEAAGIKEKFEECIMFTSEFQTPEKSQPAGLNSDTRYENFNWWICC